MMKTALLFAGQGSQTVGMGRDLCEKYEVCRQLFAHANEVLGRDIQKICFEGPVDVLTKTDNAQPAIFITSLACLAALKSQVPDLAFDATAGLSLGEFTALAAADVVSFDDGLRMVQSRGRFMQEACDSTSGGMASILNMDDDALADVCREAEVDIANINCPGQVVISGDKEKIAKAVELAKEKGAKRAIPLVVARRVSFAPDGRREGQGGGCARPACGCSCRKFRWFPMSRRVRRAASPRSRNCWCVR